MEVVIDGIRYVPAVDATSDMKAIAKGLLRCFYGQFFEITDENLREKMDRITIRVYDEGKGDSFDDVLAVIAKELAKGKETKNA